MFAVRNGLTLKNHLYIGGIYPERRIIRLDEHGDEL